MLMVLCSVLLNVNMCEAPPFWGPDLALGRLESDPTRLEECLVPTEDLGKVS